MSDPDFGPGRPRRMPIEPEAVGFPPDATQPMSTISLCMIVRDEEDSLARCLESVAGVADEIIVVDTGSRDRTRQVAAGFTPHVVDFAWIDDFAAARNESFRHATRDFILWLDADDLLLPADRHALLELKAGLNPTIDAVSMPYHVSFDAAGNVLQSTRRLRLVRRARGFVWHGVVHEDLSAEGECHTVESDIVITHRKPAAAAPSRRNLEIFERFVGSGRTLRPADVFHYARELRAHREFARAIPYYVQFLEAGQGDPGLFPFVLHELASCYHMIGDLDKEWECTLKSLDMDIPRPEFSCRFGERFCKRAMYRQAIFWYELALDGRAGGGGGGAHNHAFTTWLPHQQLAFCHYQLGDYERSLHHNRLAARYLPDDAGVAANIRMLEELVAESASRSTRAADGGA